MPSCTIVPDVIATSITFAPQALFTVPMSTPWSSVQALGERTREIGSSGNTHEPVPAGDCPGASSTPDPFAVFLTAASRVWAVSRPTTPVTGARLSAVWNWITAALVIEPK